MEETCVTCGESITYDNSEQSCDYCQAVDFCDNCIFEHESECREYLSDGD